MSTGGLMNVEIVNFACVHACHAAAYLFLADYRMRRGAAAALWAGYAAAGMAGTLALYTLFPQAAKWGIFALTVAMHALLFFSAAEGQPCRKCFLLASYLSFFFGTVPLIAWLSLPLRSRNGAGAREAPHICRRHPAVDAPGAARL